MKPVESGDRALETARKIAQSQADFDDDCNPLPVAEIVALIQSTMDAQERELREALQAIIHGALAAEGMFSPCSICRPSDEHRHEEGCPILEAERLLAERGEGQ